MENHQDNLWSLSAQKYFWLIEPEIIKKILNGFLPVRANETFAFVPFSVPNCRIARINTVINYRVILLSHKTENDFFFCLFLKRIAFTLILILKKRITMINHNSFLISTLRRFSLCHKKRYFAYTLTFWNSQLENAK